MANTPTYQTAPVDGGLSILNGASSAMGGIFAELQASKKSQSQLNSFADTLEKQGLIGDAMIYRQMAQADTPNYLEAARTGEASKRDLSAPFAHALKALDSQADREMRESLSSRDGKTNMLSQQRAIYNAADEIDTGDINQINSQVNSLNSQEATLENRLATLVANGDVEKVSAIEAELDSVKAQRNELINRTGKIQSGRRTRLNQSFGSSQRVAEPTNGNGAQGFSDLDLPTSSDSAGQGLEGLIPFSPDAVRNDDNTITDVPSTSIIGDQSINQSTATAFAGSPKVKEKAAAQVAVNPIGVSGNENIIPSQEAVAAPAVQQKSNEELSRLGELDYTKNIAIASDASTKTVLAERNLATIKQQAYIQSGGVYNEALDKARSPSQVADAMKEITRAGRNVSGIPTLESAKELKVKLTEELGEDAKSVAYVITGDDKKGYSLKPMKKSSITSSKTGSVYMLPNSVFAPDGDGFMVKVDTATRSEVMLTSMDRNNPNKKMTLSEFESAIRTFSKEQLAAALNISVEEAEALIPQKVGASTKDEKKGTIQTGAGTPPNRGSVFSEFLKAREARTAQ